MKKSNMSILGSNLLKSILVVLTFAFSFEGNSQKVDTLEINGETFLVYPFRVEVEVHRDYYQILSSTATTEYFFNKFIIEIRAEFGEDVSMKDYKKIVKSFTKMNIDKNRKFLNKKFIKAARKNPFPLLEQKYNMNTDIIPVLDPIPDGEYIQLFEDFCVSDEKGNCQSDSNRIAGIFTIKDNVLEGEAKWFNLQGDVLKTGFFKGGLKTGEWKSEDHKCEYSLTNDDAQKYKEMGHPNADTTIVICNYENAAKTGAYQRFFSSKFPVEKGNYKDGKKVGKWEYRDIVYKGWGKLRKRIRNNELITFQFTYADQDTLISKRPWIRDGLINTYSVSLDEFDFYPKYSLLNIPDDIFEYNFEKEEDLNYEDESLGSYNMDGYQEELYRDDYYGYGEYGEEFPYFQATVYDELLEKSRKRGQVIDSIGVVTNYNGAYEILYENGQVFLRYNFVDGHLEKEDTIFWSNGIAHDVITFNVDSNQYNRTVYDYEGKLFKELIYDSLGDFVRINFEYLSEKFVFLDGYKAEDPEYGDYYFYTKTDTLSAELNEPLTVFRSWYKNDSSTLYNTNYDPNSRDLVRKHYSINRNETEINRKNFSESFESWTGKDSLNIGSLTLVSTASAALYDFGFWSDSVPQENVGYPYERYDVAVEDVLFKNDIPYTGEVEFNFNMKKLSISKSGLKIKFPKYSTKKGEKLEKKIIKYRNNGKKGNQLLFSYLDASDYNLDIQSSLYNNFYSRMLGGLFNVGGEYDHYENEWEMAQSQKKSKYPKMEKIEGYMLDGKPHGIWRSYDQYNKLMTEVPFENGEISGVVKQYSYEYPLDENDYFGWGNESIGDTLPEKETYYLEHSAEYKNGMLNGFAFEYNWLNETTKKEYYEDDLRNGEWVERNNLAYTITNYKNGLLDGYMKTYLTLKGQDSILLYDLNFQDGALQGESKSFHLNGNLSKRGFFLDGQPIDDYEAYDSLGFKYHYVKFKYSYPIEEKLWEENELSVRYLFNWEDSIYFEASDITTSESLESMLYELGFGSGYLEQPYYGRPTLVEKDGVKYHMTKYYPNDTIARDGSLDQGKKVDLWKFFDYEGELLYEVDYFDSVLILNDSIRFKSKGILSDFDNSGNLISKSYIIEKFEKYDCSHSDHYEVRQLYTIWEADVSLGRMNGKVKNYYDNGVMQSEGEMKNGLPTGFWKYYDPYGKLHKYGEYVLGKRNGRWLSGDLSKTKYLGDICLNPNLPDLEEVVNYRQNLLDITITSYKYGKALNKQFYDINMNKFVDSEEEETIEIEE